MPTSNGTLVPGDPGYIAPGTGIIQAVSPDKASIGYTPASATAVTAPVSTYDPKAFAVTSDQTVQGQLKSIVDTDSPLMQQARTRANQDMQAKGLLNSSLAVEAGQNAVIAQAMPIAQQDANTYGQANTNTVNAQNAALYHNSQARNAANLQGAELGTNVNLQNMQAENTARGFGAEQANRLQLAQLDSGTRLSLAQMDNQYRQLLQQNQGMGSMFNQVLTDITNISMNRQMPRAAKERAIQTQLNFLREALAAGQELTTLDAENLQSLDLSPYFQRSTSAGSTTTSGGTTGGIVEQAAPHPTTQYEWKFSNGSTSNDINEVYKKWLLLGDESKENFLEANKESLQKLGVPLDILSVDKYIKQVGATKDYL